MWTVEQIQNLIYIVTLFSIPSTISRQTIETNENENKKKQKADSKIFAFYKW